MTTTNSQNIILRWNGHNQSSGSNESWYIRGIQLDGSFYGEIKVETSELPKLINVEGSLSSQELDEIQRLVSEISEYDEETRLGLGEYEGLLATGQVSSPAVLLKYSAKRLRESEISKKFMQIIALMRSNMPEV